MESDFSSIESIKAAFLSSNKLGVECRLESLPAEDFSPDLFASWSGSAVAEEAGVAPLVNLLIGLMGQHSDGVVEDSIAICVRLHVTKKLCGVVVLVEVLPL